MAKDFHITAADFGRQIVRGASAMLALRELDEKLTECINDGGTPELTASQKRTLRKAVAAQKEISEAVERMNTHFENFAA
jgi:hypothetical protein